MRKIHRKTGITRPVFAGHIKDRGAYRGAPLVGLTIIFSLLYSTHDVEFKDTHERTVTIRNGVSPSIRLLGGFFMPRAWEPKRLIVDN